METVGKGVETATTLLIGNVWPKSIEELMFEGKETLGACSSSTSSLLEISYIVTTVVNAL